MQLNLNKRGNMKVKLFLSSLFLICNTFVYAQDSKEGQELVKSDGATKQNPSNEADKLDVLDKQSEEFFNSVIGMDKGYLEEQISVAKDGQKKEKSQIPSEQNPEQSGILPNIIKKSDQEVSKEVFKNQSEIGRLTQEVLRSKKLQNIKIKSMYSFNGNNYVVLKTDKSANLTGNDELSSQIEGRYKKGDNILGYKISSVDIRTKSLKLYKKVDDKFGYFVFLNNYGVSISELKKRKEKETINKQKDKEVQKLEKKIKRLEKKVQKQKEKSIQNKKDEKNKIKSAFEKVGTKAKKTCYILKARKANVREKDNLKARILRVLRKGDKFSIVQKKDRWVQIDTIYKKKSGDVMNVKDEHNWLKIINRYFKSTSCL